MKLETFFEKFDQFAGATDGVAKMRGLIRTLAVSGLLFGGLKSGEWRSVRLKDVCTQITDGEHATPHRISSGVPLATAKNVRDGFLDLTNTDFVAEFTAEKCWKRCKPQHHDILMVCVGATTGRVCLVQNPPDIVLVRSVALIRPKAEQIAPSFLDLFLRSSSGQAQIWGNVKQSAQPCLYLGKMAEFEISVPPLAEQKRIVARVDELMALCDRLEAQQRERETRQAALACASLARFADAPTPANLQFLFHPSYTIPPADLRKSILTLAVQGKLVPQDPNDEPAEAMLKQVEQEKRRLSDIGELKADKKAWLNSSPNPPHNIPDSWSWVRLQDVFEISRGGSPRPAGDPRFFGGPIPWITVGEVTKDSGRYLTETATGLTEEGSERSRFINPGDLLLTNSGATLGVPKISKIRGCMNDGVAVLRLFHSFDFNEFGYLYLTHQTTALRNVNQGMGQPNLNTPIIAGWFFPLPPLAEQRRIVAKVEQLMALVDELETQLAASRATATKLLEAIVAELTAPSTTIQRDPQPQALEPTMPARPPVGKSKRTPQTRSAPAGLIDCRIPVM